MRSYSNANFVMKFLNKHRASAVIADCIEAQNQKLLNALSARQLTQQGAISSSICINTQAIIPTIVNFVVKASQERANIGIMHYATLASVRSYAKNVVEGSGGSETSKFSVRNIVVTMLLQGFKDALTVLPCSRSWKSFKVTCLNTMMK